MQQDISLRELRDLNLAVAQQLAQVTTQHDDLTDTMRQMFAEVRVYVRTYVRMYLRIYLQQCAATARCSCHGF